MLQKVDQWFPEIKRKRSGDHLGVQGDLWGSGCLHYFDCDDDLLGAIYTKMYPTSDFEYARLI